ncbi:hypothetical protein HanPI659440_Chr12g0461161 [Helianthus annuus]|nr:hypothetical protein HanPI659440_Chr12g0461161 [Helianthus annuus]
MNLSTLRIASSFSDPFGGDGSVVETDKDVIVVVDASVVEEFAEVATKPLKALP